MSLLSDLGHSRMMHSTGYMSGLHMKRPRVTQRTSAYGTDLGWRSDMEKHCMKGMRIGGGSFGNVYKGIVHETGKEVAIKVMAKTRGKLSKEKTLLKIKRETEVLSSLKGSYGAIQLHCCFEDEACVYLVTDYCSGGDLQASLETRGPMSEKSVASVAREVLKIIQSCHDHGVLHGDIKPANFVVVNSLRNPLCSPDGNSSSSWLNAVDFGCSQFITTKHFTKRAGTPVYMAPEVFNRDYGVEVDMWSLGIMLYQLYTGRFPFWDTNGVLADIKMEDVERAVLNFEIPFDYDPWHSMSCEGIDFIRGCLHRSYSERLTPVTAMNHKWLRSTEEIPISSMSNNIVPSFLSVKEAMIRGPQAQLTAY